MNAGNPQQSGAEDLAVVAARLAAIVESSEDAIVGKDLRGIVTSWNTGAEQIFGYTAAEMIGQPFARVIPAEREDEETEILAKIARGERVGHFETIRIGKDGRKIDLSVTVSPIRDATGRVVGASKVARDITGRKRTESLIPKLTAELEHRVAERTSQLEAANKELESFSYSVSHDLRARLRHVLGYVELLKRATDGQLSGKAGCYLKTISDAAEEMGELIDDLLAFSRMGRAEMRAENVALDEPVQQVIKSLEMETRYRRIEWKIGPLPKVTGDAAMLRLVLMNLIGNAVKYTSTRDLACIEIGCSESKDGRAVIFVRDNGVGFDMQYAHKLFGVFQRLHRPEEFPGTGIGLATVRRIITRHGGAVRAEGALDQGATFYFAIGLASAIRTSERH